MAVVDWKGQDSLGTLGLGPVGQGSWGSFGRVKSLYRTVGNGSRGKSGFPGER